MATLDLLPSTRAPADLYCPDEADWPALGACLGSGSFRRHFRTLLAHFGSCRALLAATRGDLEAVPDLETRSINALAAKLPRLQPRDPRAGLDRLGARVVTWWDADYPAALRTTPWPPPVFFLQGELTCQLPMTLAIVGTRRPTPYGKQVAGQFARELAGHGFTIVSGGAYGIDAAAHRGALESGGRTVAVFGTGLDNPYPESHRDLYAAIVAAGGACMTEYPPGTPPLAEYFPQRNRLVAGLARATLVIEAGGRSGALITASLALEAGREVLVIPGRISDPTAAGSNQLLRDGATCITSVEDLIHACGLILAKSVTTPDSAADQLEGLERRVYQALSLDQEQVDDLALRLELAVHEVASVLLVLELKGFVRSLPGQHFVRASLGRSG
ncbi:MAG TPA: DNA-processing protein DprA [bacterium]|nr:DNA-processing protein DprA [bacterium]